MTKQLNWTINIYSSSEYSNTVMKVKAKVLVTQSCLTLWNPMDCSLPGSSVHGILQARIQEWVAISYSRGSSWPRDLTHFFCTAGRFFTVWATREVNTVMVVYKSLLSQVEKFLNNIKSNHSYNSMLVNVQYKNVWSMTSVA